MQFSIRFLSLGVIILCCTLDFVSALVNDADFFKLVDMYIYHIVDEVFTEVAAFVVVECVEGAISYDFVVEAF